MKKIVFLLLLATPALAEEPSDLTKKQALIQAYKMNGNSMVRWGMIDMSRPSGVDVREKDKIVCGWVKGDVSGDTFYECHDMVSPGIAEPAPAPHAAVETPVVPRKIATVSVEPEPGKWTKPLPDVCKRHGLRKVWNSEHDYWNCRRK